MLPVAADQVEGALLAQERLRVEVRLTGADVDHVGRAGQGQALQGRDRGHDHAVAGALRSVRDQLHVFEPARVELGAHALQDLGGLGVGRVGDPAADVLQRLVAVVGRHQQGPDDPVALLVPEARVFDLADRLGGQQVARAPHSDVRLPAALDHGPLDRVGRAAGVGVHDEHRALLGPQVGGVLVDVGPGAGRHARAGGVDDAAGQVGGLAHAGRTEHQQHVLDGDVDLLLRQRVLADRGRDVQGRDVAGRQPVQSRADVGRFLDHGLGGQGLLDLPLGGEALPPLAAHRADPGVHPDLRVVDGGRADQARTGTEVPAGEARADLPGQVTHLRERVLHAADAAVGLQRVLAGVGGGGGHRRCTDSLGDELGHRGSFSVAPGPGSAFQRRPGHLLWQRW